MEEYLDRFIGEKGIKTDVSVSLNPKVYIPLGATMVVSIIIGMALGSMVRGLMK